MERNKLITTIICSFLLLGNATGEDGEFPRGTLIDTVACLSDGGQTYSLYLPRAGESPPALLVFLEPGARGKLPVGLYKDLAERYGLILASSNNGRNGPEKYYRDALDAMIPDLVKRFSPDTSRLILAGFSGGARYASQYSIKRMRTGVIACGAGISPNGGIEQLDVPYYTGIVGRMDMNFIDVIATIQDAQTRGTPAWMIANGSGHFWPDTLSFSRALDQVLVYWHTSGLREVPAWELERIRTDMYAQFDSLLDTDRFYEIKLMETNFRVHPLFNPEDEEWIRIASRLPKGDLKKKTDQEWEKILEREWAYIDTMERAFAGINYALYNRIDRLKPNSWWKQRRKQVQKLMDSKDAIVSESGHRLFDYTWRSCWTWGVTHMGEPLEPEQAARYFIAWSAFYPDSPDAFYWLAGAYGAAGEDKKALKSLEKAVENGFSSLRRIEQADAFNSLRNKPEYMEIIRKLKSP